MEVLESIAKIIWQDSLSMIIEYISMVNLIRDKREEHKYIYKAFRYNNTSYSIFFSQYKHLFNINPNHLSVPLILALIRKMINNEIVYNKQECK